MTEQRVADPGPLGLAGFAMTTFCLSSANANIWHGGGVAAALALAMFYGGLAQLLAGMWEFVRKNTFAAVAFTSYGAFWLAFYALVKFNLGAGTDTVAIFLLGWTIFTLYMTVAASRVSMAVLTVFVLLSLTFLLLTIGNWGAGHTSMVHAGGWVGLATAVAAWYASAAGVINETHGRMVLPTGPRG
ncbi:MAG: acetate uptake transporter [Acidobacteriota bacterium]|nr:acetate uptake transporter [Acidobacteriota bacterium]MDE3043813.1 acetate uptake transporter [Acidobacteriota bacterium]MDE3106707.1 acetate uptake transporter [Acidobacteriota bacterium]MDE3223221.1 acetate uptake transporter [Acidobacteriota bacterium]